MQIKLRDAPDVLFDKKRWKEFCGRFVSKDAALAAISRPPCGRYGYHGDEEDCVPASPEQRTAYAEATFRLGNELVGWLKQTLISGALKSRGTLFRLQYERGEDKPIDIPGQQWKGLWPEFIDGSAFGGSRYVNVWICSDDRKNFNSSIIEDNILDWMLNYQDADRQKKERLRADASEHFGYVPVRVFNRAYSRAFGRKRGAPRRTK